MRVAVVLTRTVLIDHIRDSLSMATPKNVTRFTVDLNSVEHRITVVEQRHEGLQNLVQAQDVAYARVEVLLAAFAIILTILVIYLGFRVEQSAIKSAAAQGKKELDDSKSEIEGCVNTVRAMLADAKVTMLEIEGHKLVAASDTQEIRNLKDQVTQSNPKRRSGHAR